MSSAQAPCISVIMAVHNGGLYLNAAVESILSQTFADFEFIIIDDGSTDKSIPTLAQYAGSDRRVRLVSRPNRGLTASLNEALGMARGRFIARMDADDVSHPDRLLLQLKEVQSDSSVVALGSFAHWISPEGWRLGTWRVPLNHAEIDRAHIGGVPGQIIHPSLLARKAALAAVGGYDEKWAYAQDYDLWLRLAEVGRLRNLGLPLLEYRLHSDSVSLSKQRSQYDSVAAIHSAARSRRKLPPGSLITWEDYRGLNGPPNPDNRARCYRISLWSREYLTAARIASQIIRAAPLKILGWRCLFSVPLAILRPYAAPLKRVVRPTRSLIPPSRPNASAPE